MSDTLEDLPTRDRILSVCVKLFLEKGYKKTTVADITRLAKVSNSSFQHFFRAKDGVLTELVHYMFGTQFDMAGAFASQDLPPVYLYAVETSLQMTLTELHKNLREIYLEAYTHEEALDYIHHMTAKKVHQIFGSYQPELTERDFYVLELGSAGLMRGYMAQPCDEEFSLDQKVRWFLTSALRVYKVPEAEVQQVLAFIMGLGLRSISQQVMQQVIQTLAKHYAFSLTGLIEGPEDGA